MRNMYDPYLESKVILQPLVAEIPSETIHENQHKSPEGLGEACHQRSNKKQYEK